MTFDDINNDFHNYQPVIKASPILRPAFTNLLKNNVYHGYAKQKLFKIYKITFTTAILI